MIQVINKYGAVKAPAPAPSSAIWGTIVGAISAQLDLTSYLSSNFYPLSNPSSYISGITSGMVTTALGYTPENTTNKQNSLAVDGTSTKYPTVDAVNSLLVPSKVDGFVFSGSYMPCTIGYYTMSVGSAIMGFIIAQNILPRKTCTITSLSAYCSTGVAGGNIRLAIYSDLNGMPNNLLVDSGNIACISPGLKEAAITPFVLQGQTKYHICHQTSSNSILLRFNAVTDRLYYQASNNLYVPNKLATFPFAAFPAIYPLASVLPTFDGFGYCTEIFLKAQ